jgi:hypothetical protein
LSPLRDRVLVVSVLPVANGVEALPIPAEGHRHDEALAGLVVS